MSDGRTSGMVFERAADVTYEVVRIEPRTVEMITLNHVGSLAGQDLDGDKAVREVAAALVRSFPGTRAEEFERDITTFLRELAEAALVVTADAAV